MGNIGNLGGKEEIGKNKCRKAEYVQRRVRFINVQVPYPHSIIYVKFCTSRLFMKCRLFCLWAHEQCRVYYIYHVEFHFQFGQLISGVQNRNGTPHD